MAQGTLRVPPRTAATDLLGMLLRFQARARLEGPREGDVGPAGQMAWFVVGRTLLIPFWINPQSYREASVANSINQPTPGLVRRTYFAPRPQTISLEGTTGTAGWDARRGGMVDLGRLKPFVGARAVPVEFHYPYMFAGGRYCFVNRFMQEARSTEAPLFYYYQIELSVYPEGATLPCGTVAESRADPPAAPPRRTSGGKVHTPDKHSSMTNVTLRPTHDPVPDTALTRAGGAAIAMADEMRDLSNKLVWIMNHSRSGIISAFTNALKAELKEQVVAFIGEALIPGIGEGLDVAEFAGDVVFALGSAILNVGTHLPGMNGSEYTVVACTAFDALWHNNGAYVTGAGGTRDLWKAGITANWSFFAGSTVSGKSASNLPWQALMLVGLLKVGTEDNWQGPAAKGAKHPASLAGFCASWPQT